MEGLGIRDAAIFAGCPEKTASQAGSRLEKHANVVAHLARLKQVESETVPGAGQDAAPPGVPLDAEFYDDPKELLRHATCDVLLLDLNLPGRSGMEVLASLHESHPQIKALIARIAAAPIHKFRCR